MPKNNVQQIAEKAGVSIATVSRILNGKLGHSPETIRRVKALADELARENTPVAPSTAVSNAIGIVVYDYPNFLCNTYVATLLDGIVGAANAQGYSTMLITVAESTCNPEYIRNMIAFYRLQGVIIPGNHYLYKLIRDIKKLSIPAVSINSALPDMLPAVSTDAVRRGEDAANYLLNYGHRRVGIVTMTGDQDHAGICEGFFRIYRKFVPGEKVMHWEYRDIEDAIFYAVNTIAGAAVRPTALFFANSSLARRFYLALLDRNLEIPGDISILSCEEYGELVDIGITTLAQPTHQMGKAAAKLLLKQIHDPSEVQNEVFFCSFKERASIKNLNTGNSRSHFTRNNP